MLDSSQMRKAATVEVSNERRDSFVQIYKPVSHCHFAASEDQQRAILDDANFRRTCVVCVVLPAQSASARSDVRRHSALETLSRIRQKASIETTTARRRMILLLITVFSFVNAQPVSSILNQEQHFALTNFYSALGL